VNALKNTAEPTVLRPGDPAVDGSFLEPYTSEWSVGQLKPDGTTRKVGDWADRVEIEEQNGRPAVRRTQTAIFGATRFRYVNVADPATMAPILSEEESSKGSFEHLVFDGTRVRHRHRATPAGGVEERDLPLAMPVFQFTGMYGILLVTFPLHEGSFFQLPSFEVKQADHIEWLSFRVKGREGIPTVAGEAEAWIVESEPGPGARFRFSLRREPPYVFRLDHEKDGTILRWDLL